MKMRTKKTLFISLVTASLPVLPLASASDQIGKFVAIEGDVRLFSKPSKSLPKNVDSLPPLPVGTSRVLFEREYYEAVTARPGMEIDYGNIVRTAPGAKAMVIFPNGDNYMVGPSTAYRVFWSKDAKGTRPQVSLLHGRLRGVVAPGGPRSDLKIRTRSATMGVRGTDFYIGENSETGELEVAVQRGKVAVVPTKPTAAPLLTAPPALAPKVELAKAVEVTPGKVATVAAKPEAKPVAVAQSDKGLLTEIQGLTRVDSKKQEKLVASLAPEVAKEVEELQKKAIETTLKDVQRVNPNAIATLPTSIQDLNANVLQEIAKVAPVGAPRKLPEDLAGVDSTEAYERYFQ